jgi:predicted AAA+ superfamily ATPase
LEASFIVFLLPPFHRNISKRLIKSPKLYFYDVGLASYLLGLETELQVGRDPLRGNLFENLVVMEFLKYRLNQGKRSNLTFYRDSSGNEVDLVLEFGADLFPVEIKAGATVVPDFFRGLKRFSRVFPQLPLGGAVVYGGSEVQLRTDVKVYPSVKINELIDSIDL